MEDEAAAAARSRAQTAVREIQARVDVLAEQVSAATASAAKTAAAAHRARVTRPYHERKAEEPVAAPAAPPAPKPAGAPFRLGQSAGL